MNYLGRIESWVFKRILRKQVTQGYDHDKRISNIYAMVREACEQEFYEDNAPTLDANLREWFERAQKTPALAQARSLSLAP